MARGPAAPSPIVRPSTRPTESSILRLEVIITQLVNVFRAGEPVRMSTRAGEFVPFREVIDEVGIDAVRYYLLAVTSDTTVNFDLEEAKRQSMDNPVYYLQYAHARVRSLESFATDQGVRRAPIDEVDLSVLDDPAEIELLKQAAQSGAALLPLPWPVGESRIGE